ncbi:MAG: DUF4367 domain-containing protein [Clostridia bacterium]|nr:DUF4367 domain-containing protein [Clostridia bacterium]
MGAFEQACIMSNESFLKTIPDVLPQPEYSKKHIRAMNRIINKMRDDHYHRFTTGTVKVLVVAAIILSLALSAFAIPSVREYVITQFKTHSVFRAVSTEDSKPVTDLTVGYIPEGFELVEEENKNERSVCVFANGDDWFIVEKSMNKTEVGIDTEESGITRIVHDDMEYLFYINPQTNSGTLWYREDYIYSIKGTISQDEQIEIAKSTI